ncbi:MAG: hypothetical protein A2020_06530 [Lentisphaerae bacterium GWF2_45_14]|nr:MAG: hypothetical protein A2020_06530 [Lentisphaerae bacterium GWF2_45_14]
MKFKAVIFDMDGTLTVPTIDFDLIRKELGIPDGDMVNVIASWPEARRDAAWALIQKYESESKIIIKDGVLECLKKFRELGIMLGILTRNSADGVSRVAEKLRFDFDMVLTREHEYVKPDPETVRCFLREWELEPGETLVVGDYIHDIECARNAGARSCFYFNSGSRFYGDESDFTVKNFRELEAVVIGE